MSFDRHLVLETALEESVDAVVLADDVNRITFFNAAAERLWGYHRGDVLGKDIKDFVPCGICPTRDGYVDANRDGYANKIVRTSREARIEREDGKEVWGSFSLSKVDIGDKIHYLVFIRDVTEEVQRREELRLLSLVVNETDRTVMVLDQNRRIIYVNRAFSDQFGYRIADALGKLPTDFLVGEGTDVDTLARLQRKAWQDQGFTEDILCYDRSGNPVWVSAAVNPIRDAQGDVTNVVVELTDIAALKRVQSLQDDVLEALASNISLAEVMDFLCRRVEAIAPEIVSSILLVDTEQKLWSLAGPSLPTAYNDAIAGVPAGENTGSCGTAVWRGEPVYVTDIATDPLWTNYKHLALPHGLRACWSSPIRLGDGRIAGTFAFYYREPRGPSAFHRQIVKACLYLCKLAIEHQEARRQIAVLSHFDSLTGLPNRSRLLEETESILRKAEDEGLKVAIFTVNLDHFKDINSSLGHAIGDKVLIEAAYRLQRLVSDFAAIVARAGSDSFVVVLSDCDTARAAVRADKILRAISEPTEIKGFNLTLSASIGISISGDKGTDPESLLKHAETAMFQAKSAGRGVYRFFSPEMNRLAQDRLVLGAALRNALSTNSLNLHYQPQINLNSNTLHGVEALARWHDPELGNIPPDRFIPLAEEIGLIDTIGKWSLRESCRQIAAWRSEGIPIPTVSVNLSPLHFNDSGLPGYVAGLLEEFNLPAACLTIEITESVMMDAGAETLRTLAKLHETGVGLSMDDFGTGFSSLSSLTRMPITELKLDRSFMRNFETDPSVQAVAATVVGIGLSLGMTVVSEGVENENQARLLRRLNCTVAQGYYFARPMEACDIERWICATRLDDTAPLNISA